VYVNLRENSEQIHVKQREENR